MSKRELEKSDSTAQKKHKVNMKGVNRFVEWDMMTTDLKKSVDFYSGLFEDWTFEENGMGDICRIAKVDGTVIGGFVQEKELPCCHWMPYIGVESIDKAIEAVKANNGKVCFDPVKMPHGKFTVIDDVSGAHVSLIELDTKDYEVQPYQMHYPCFNELYCKDVTEVRDFYKAVADWTLETPDERGWAAFIYGSSADKRGAAMNFPVPEMTKPEWATYFHVKDINTTVEKVKQFGGKVCCPVMEIPVGSFCFCSDTMGAKFALFQSNWEFMKAENNGSCTAKAEEEKNTSKITHITVLVSDQEAAKTEYLEKLGFKLVMDGKTPDGKIRWLTVRRPDDSSFEFSLMKPMEGDEALIGNQTVSDMPLAIIQTPEVDKDLEDLKAAGVKVMDAKDVPWGREGYFFDSDGNKFSLVKPKFSPTAALRKSWILTYYVDEHEKALKFLTELGWVVSMDMSDFGMRWLTMKPSKEAFTELTVIVPKDDVKSKIVGKQTGDIPLIVWEVPDALASFAAFKEKGVEIVQEPKEQPWGTEMVIKDPFGTRICVMTSKPFH